MPQKLANRQLVEADVRYAVRAGAKNAAKLALEEWYKLGFSNADSAIRELQIESNLKIVKAIPGWQENKGNDTGYVMLDMWLSEAQRPVVVTLDYENKAWRGLTYRQPQEQIRLALELEPKVSMRLRCHRPWCRYMLDMHIPGSSALPANDAQCRHLLGTTLSCWSYVHLTYECEGSRGFWSARGRGSGPWPWPRVRRSTSRTPTLPPSSPRGRRQGNGRSSTASVVFDRLAPRQGTR